MKRRGFTLIELLIVLSILIILFTLVVAVYQANQGTDRMRAAARQLQSAILGARDRAIHAKAPRGLRLIADATDPSIVTSVVYLGQVPNWTEGKVQLGRPDINPKDNVPDSDIVRTLRAVYATTPSQRWYELWTRGLLKNGARIKLPKTGGSWYTITIDTNQLTATNDVLILTADYKSTPTYGYPANVKGFDPFDYELELAASPLQGEQPISLPSGCVIDLDNSRIPGGWYNSSAGTYYLTLDIMFSPRGTVTGPYAASGIIHLLLAETGDTTTKIAGDSATAQSSSLHKPRTASRTIPPECTQGEKLIVTLFTRTGAVSTHPMDPTGALGADGLAGVATTNDDSDSVTDSDSTTSLPDPEEIGYGDDNPRERYRYAEAGASAGK